MDALRRKRTGVLLAAAVCGCGGGDEVVELCGDGRPADGGCEGVRYVVTGGYHSCALFRSGRVRCWGRNEYGQLGLGHTRNVGDDELPRDEPFVELGQLATDLAAGAWFTCALLGDGTMRCWGANHSGQLGLGNEAHVGDDELPTAVAPLELGERVLQMAPGGAHMCVRLESGRVRCWGSNDSGELGYGHVQSLGDDEPIPSASVDVGAPVVDLSAGAAGTCVVTDAGGVRCWGDNETFGQLGYANFEQIGDDEVPAVAGDVPTLGGARDVEMHGLGWCARTLDERVACWYGGTLASGSQALDVALPNTPRDFGGSVYEACALVEPSLLGCWPCFNPPASPEVTLFSLGYETEAISSGGVSVHFCSWGNGSVHCWGDNSYGQLGTGDTRAWTPLDAPNAQIE